MKKINYDELVVLLNNVKSNDINVTFVRNSGVNQKLDDIESEHGYISAIETGNVSIGGTYAERIAEALAKKKISEEYQCGARPWGEFMMKGIVLYENGKRYLRVYYHPKNILTSFLNNAGKEISNKYMLENKLYVPMANEVKKQTKAGLYGDEQVLMHNIRFDSIIDITLDGVTYQVNDCDTAMFNGFLRKFKNEYGELIGNMLRLAELR